MTDSFHLIEHLTVKRSEGCIIWILNIGAEAYWNRLQASIVDRNENRIVGRVEEMNLLICREQDILILREQPDSAYLEQLRQWGFAVPRIVVPNESDPLTPIAELVLRDEELLEQLRLEAAERDDVCFVPYGVTRLEEEIAERCGLRLIGAPSVLQAKINDKVFNRQIAEQLDLATCQGFICSSVDEIRAAYDSLTQGETAFEKVIVKEPHGASGKGLYIIDHPDKLKSLLTRLSRAARQNPSAQWLVEGWYEKKGDVNYQIYIAGDGSVEMFSLKEQILRDTVYIGSKIPAELSPEQIEAYHGYARKIGAYLYELGYTGVAGIDSIITMDDTIIPIIEINGRFTLSTYISFTERVLGQAKLFSRYFKWSSDTPCGFTEICGSLEKEGLLYDSASGEGVLVYTSGTLPTSPNEGAPGYSGRLFTLIAAHDWDTVDRLSASLEDFVQRMSDRVAISAE